MRKTSMVLVALLALALGALTPTGAAGKGKQLNRSAYGLAIDGSLVSFDATNTSRSRSLGQVTGLAAGERLVGIDFRPATSELIALGDKAGVYSIEVPSARAVKKSSLQTADGSPVTLTGTHFGIDFNPTVDRLRVVSDAGQNLRVNADSGTTAVDGAINYPAGGRDAGRAPQLVGAAYTNNDNDSYVTPALTPFNRPFATGTSLYTVDSALDSVALQDPPNSGTLRTVGRLGKRTSSDVGFDIYSSPNSQGDTGANTAYASLRRGGRTRLYTVSVRTGKAKRIRGGGRAFRNVADIAIVP